MNLEYLTRLLSVLSKGFGPVFIHKRNALKPILIDCEYNTLNLDFII
jgi:hypothetical protein